MSEPAAPDAPASPDPAPEQGKPDCAWCAWGPAIGLAILGITAAWVVASLVTGGSVARAVARWKDGGDGASAG